MVLSAKVQMLFLGLPDAEMVALAQLGERLGMEVKVMNQTGVAIGLWQVEGGEEAATAWISQGMEGKPSVLTCLHSVDLQVVHDGECDYQPQQGLLNAVARLGFELKVILYQGSTLGGVVVYPPDLDEPTQELPLRSFSHPDYQLTPLIADIKFVDMDITKLLILVWRKHGYPHRTNQWFRNILWNAVRTAVHVEPYWAGEGPEWNQFGSRLAASDFAGHDRIYVECADRNGAQMMLVNMACFLAHWDQFVMCYHGHGGFVCTEDYSLVMEFMDDHSGVVYTNFPF